MKVAIIDYQLSNLFSVKHACDYVGMDAVITSDPKVVEQASACILPGVGAFGDAMKNLNNFKLVQPIKEQIAAGKPFMGICLGLQLLFGESNEFGKHKGLGIFKGNVVKFPNKKNGNLIRVPHMGWNKVKILKENRLLNGVKDDDFMYFVHSYYIQPKQKGVALTNSTYEGISFCSGVSQDNVFAVQFHPEKSGQKGLSIYKNFAKTIK